MDVRETADIELSEETAPSPEAWAAWQKRVARIERWSRPLESGWDRLRAWANMLGPDHGILRYVVINRHRIGPKAWRSAQPLPHHIRQFAEAGGRTVVSLRGGQTFGSLPLEIEGCRRYGLEFRVCVLRSRGLPERDHFLRVLDFIDSIEEPVLFHCKSGADRVGLMSALYLILREGRSPGEAMAQLSRRFGHFRNGPTGVLDLLMEAYAADHDRDAIGLREWVETRYDPEAITAGFRPSGWGRLLVDAILRRE